MKKIITISCLFFFFVTKAQTFTGTGGAIQNNGQDTYFPISVSGLSPAQIDSIFGLEKITINIVHPAVEELYVYLQSPSGNIVELTAGTSCSGVNYTNTCFDSQAGTSVTLGTAPFSGTFKPIGYLGRFNTGQAGNGTWNLIVHDGFVNTNAGSLINWNITFGNTPPHPVVFTVSDLPIMIINTNNQTIGNTNVMVNMGVIYNGAGQQNHMTDPMNSYNAKALIHLHGNSTRYFEKQSYSLETHDNTGAKFVNPLLGMPKETDWDLIAPYQDKTMARIPVGYDLFGRMGHYSPRYRIVELVVNNEYRGIYHLVEKPKRDSMRIHVAKLLPTSNTYPLVSGGYIIKIDRNDVAGWYSLLPGDAPNNKKFYYAYDYPKDSVITAPQKAYIKSVLDTFETVMGSSNYADPVNGYSKYIAVSSFIDYFIMNELSRNVDAYRLHAYLYKNNDTKNNHKLNIGPVWDFGIAFHNCNYGNSFNPVGWEYPLQDTTNPSPTWWKQFMADTNFTNQLYCRWTQLRQNILSIPYLNSSIDSVANKINSSLTRNYTQWPVMGAYIWPNPQNEVGATYSGEVNDLKTWLANRIAWMDGAIVPTSSTIGHCLITGVAENIFDNNFNVYPNPMESTTTFSMRLDDNADVSLCITDVIGKEVHRYLKSNTSPGELKITFDKKQIPAGAYFYQLQINNHIKKGKIIIQ
ncbi:MAG TPA: CotH kinase family protein [Bacteroidia bacterium]|jgi:subtilisin-like proprotein convertase family protein|nr:CotH kinase family protein [Bacteroidia bacterium]